MNEDWRADAELDGRPAEPVTEAALQRVAADLRAIVAVGDHPQQWALGDIADWLAGTLGAPGSGYPVRMPVPDADQ